MFAQLLYDYFSLLNNFLQICPNPPPSNSLSENPPDHRQYFSRSVCRCGEWEATRSEKSGSKIFGGEDAKPGTEKWIAMVKSTGGSCTGSLINNKMVLTAAHCVTEEYSNNSIISIPAADLLIWLNRRNGYDDNADLTSEMNFATDVFVHPGYERKFLRYDVAIIVLKKEVNFEKSSARPICLPSTSEFYDVPGRSDGIAFGYGRIDNGSNEELLELPSKLQQGSISFQSLSDCIENYNNVKHALGVDFEFSVEHFDTHICSAGFPFEEIVFTFQGDSGGPVTLPLYNEDTSQLISIVQVGIVSGGNIPEIPPAQINDPSVTYRNSAVELYADIYRALPLIDFVSDWKNATWCLR